MIRLRVFLLAAVALELSACVPVPDDLKDEVTPSTSASQEGPFEGLDPGASELDSLHFKVRAYGSQQAQAISEQAEASYNRVMNDTNLFSFQPKRLYTLVVYGSPNEYHAKTHQPEWSGGVTVGTSIYTFFGPGLNMTIAHEMTHLIFYEYMGPMIVSNTDFRWLNEGLAVYEEQKAATATGYPGDIFSSVRPMVRSQPMPMDQMVHLTPTTERDRTVSLWYAQAQSMVQFMIEKGSRMGFSAFLGSIQNGHTTDQAITASFSGSFTNLNDYYIKWSLSLTQ